MRESAVYPHVYVCVKHASLIVWAVFVEGGGVRVRG